MFFLLKNFLMHILFRSIFYWLSGLILCRLLTEEIDRVCVGILRGRGTRFFSLLCLFEFFSAKTVSAHVLLAFFYR